MCHDNLLEAYLLKMEFILIDPFNVDSRKYFEIYKRKFHQISYVHTNRYQIYIFNAFKNSFESQYIVSLF